VLLCDALDYARFYASFSCWSKRPGFWWFSVMIKKPSPKIKYILCSGFPFPANFTDGFVETLIMGFLRCVLLVSGMTMLTTALLRHEKCRNLSVPRTRVLFFVYSFNSKKLLGYLNLSDFHETWPKCSTHIKALKCARLLWNSQYFSCISGCMTTIKNISIV